MSTYLAAVIFTVKGEIDQHRPHLQLRLPYLREDLLNVKKAIFPAVIVIAVFVVVARDSPSPETSDEVVRRAGLNTAVRERCGGKAVHLLLRHVDTILMEALNPRRRRYGLRK